MYKQVVSPFLDKFVDPEWGHDFVKELLHFGEAHPFSAKIIELLAHKGSRFSHKKLQISLGGMTLENPLIVAAGWDKHGRAVKGLWHLEFAGVEVGSVLAFPQPGNPKGRFFKLGDGVYLNRMGFNSHGMEVVERNLQRYKNCKIPIGINVGINKTISAEEAPLAYAMVVKRLYSHANYFVVNVSSPNTPGLRKLQNKKPLTQIVQAVQKAIKQMGGNKPLYVKIAPDLTNSAINDVLEIAIQNKVAGIITTNTTNRAAIKAKYGQHWKDQLGGVSGDDSHFRQMSTDKVAFIYKNAGKKLEIIGVGGVKDWRTALEKIQAGAKAVQLLTAIRSEGPGVASKINRGLVEWMDKNKIKNISEIVGVNASKY